MPAVKRMPLVRAALLVMALACPWRAGADARAADGVSQRRGPGSTGAAVPVQMPSNEEREAARKEYSDARRVVHRELAGRGCKATAADVDVIADRLAKELQPLASRGMFGLGDFRYELNNTRRAACDVEKNGAIPPFERALGAMVDGRRLDPCTYDPSDAAGLAAIVDDPLYLQYNSRRDYDSASFGTQNYRRYLNEDARRGECFLDLIRSKLTGRPWTPSGPGTNATFAPADRRSRPATARPTAAARAIVPAPATAALPASSAAAAAASSAPAPVATVRTSDLPPSPVEGALAAFEAGTAVVSVTLVDGTTAAFVVDQSTTITDAAGVPHLLLRSGTQYLSPGIRVRVQWTTASDDRALAQRVTVVRRR